MNIPNKSSSAPEVVLPFPATEWFCKLIQNCRLKIHLFSGCFLIITDTWLLSKSFRENPLSNSSSRSCDSENVECLPNFWGFWPNYWLLNTLWTLWSWFNSWLWNIVSVLWQSRAWSLLFAIINKFPQDPQISTFSTVQCLWKYYIFDLHLDLVFPVSRGWKVLPAHFLHCSSWD